jgi:cob(I)alamin adenosyltransferase
MKTPSAQGREVSREARNRIVLVTGDGKGKTTSALGTVLRAAGHGQRVCVIQLGK